MQDYRDRRIIPYTQFASKILYKTSDLERILEKNYKGGRETIRRERRIIELKTALGSRSRSAPSVVFRIST